MRVQTSGGRDMTLTVY